MGPHGTEVSIRSISDGLERDARRIMTEVIDAVVSCGEAEPKNILAKVLEKDSIASHPEVTLAVAVIQIFQTQPDDAIKSFMLDCFQMTVDNS